MFIIIFYIKNSLQYSTFENILLPRSETFNLKFTKLFPLPFFRSSISVKNFPHVFPKVMSRAQSKSIWKRNVEKRPRQFPRARASLKRFCIEVENVFVPTQREPFCIIQRFFVRKRGVRGIKMIRWLCWLITSICVSTCFEMRIIRLEARRYRKMYN